MASKSEFVQNIAFAFVTRLREAVGPYLRDPFLLKDGAGNVTLRKTSTHEQYGIDAIAQKLLIEVLKNYEFRGKVFSEESGWITVGKSGDLKIVCDPFDSTFLATRSIVLPATSLCIVDRQNRFLCCAIADLGNDITYFADKTGAYAFTFQSQEWKLKGKIQVSAVESLEEAFVVLPTMQPTRREHLDAKIFQVAWYWLNASGGMFIGKLASGFIDAYLDPFKGQPLYEVSCAELILRAGGIVTDRSGEPYNLQSIIERLESGDTSRYTIVACSTKFLHKEILKLI